MGFSDGAFVRKYRKLEMLDRGGRNLASASAVTRLTEAEHEALARASPPLSALGGDLAHTAFSDKVSTHHFPREVYAGNALGRRRLRWGISS